MASIPTTGVRGAAVVPTTNAIARQHPTDGAEVELTGGFWGERAATIQGRTIPAGFERLRDVGTLHNFELAATSAREGYRALGVMFDGPFPFLDSDVYKWLEGAGWALGRAPDPAIREMADAAIALVERAQRPDGYLNTFVQVLRPGAEYQDLQWGHELYCLGHLIQASIAWHRALGDDRLLLVAERAVAGVWRALGPRGREGIDGHPEIEMALVELFRATGDRRHLELAATFIDRRGAGLLGDGRFGRAYWQDHLPVREAPTAVGHAVRQAYLDAGAVDVAVELGDQALLDAVHRRWRSMVATKTYLTGAIGSRHKDESFGDPFELPPDRAYAETCAAIASVMLAWRLQLATGDPACADVIERTMLNGVLSGLSLDGTSFFYVNPLQRRTDRAWADPADGGRQAWYPCACCPPNLMRIIGAWPQMLATVGDAGVHLHQYARATLEVPVPGGRASLAMETDYPWDGSVRIRIRSAPGSVWELAVRVPGWCPEAVLHDGRGPIGTRDPDGRAIRATRAWNEADEVELSLPMPARVVRPDPRIDAVRGCIALERGPFVYAVETADLPAGVVLEDVVLDPRVAATARPVPRDDIAPGMIGLTVPALAAVDGDASAGTRRIDVGAIPYYAWANRSVEAMRVWLPVLPSPDGGR